MQAFGSPWKLESDEDMSVLVHSVWPLYFFDGCELCLRVRIEGFSTRCDAFLETPISYFIPSRNPTLKRTGQPGKPMRVNVARIRRLCTRMTLAKLVC